MRVSKDIRIIVHRTSASLLLCYVDHHDEAYRWAERRRIETHPKTSAVQLVEVLKTVKEIPFPGMSRVEQPALAKTKSLLFGGITQQPRRDRHETGPTGRGCRPAVTASAP